ncbi:hypothetical protein VP01_504g1 [Puccinia sorghi]|uniref:Uncharacterized protein n=1 Tax=Puccinia sorghi TaxID=27349 RepID=A0A0L6ULI2_9BASI|nr:hypothetical protein VP01_504g1 [Puccinia sorghi]
MSFLRTFLHSPVSNLLSQLQHQPVTAQAHGRRVPESNLVFPSRDLKVFDIQLSMVTGHVTGTGNWELEQVTGSVLGTGKGQERKGERTVNRTGTGMVEKYGDRNVIILTQISIFEMGLATRLIEHDNFKKNPRIFGIQWLVEKRKKGGLLLQVPPCSQWALWAPENRLELVLSLGIPVLGSDVTFHNKKKNNQSSYFVLTHQGSDTCCVLVVICAYLISSEIQLKKFCNLALGYDAIRFEDQPREAMIVCCLDRNLALTHELLIINYLLTIQCLCHGASKAEVTNVYSPCWEEVFPLSLANLKTGLGESVSRSGSSSEDEKKRICLRSTGVFVWGWALVEIQAADLNQVIKTYAKFCLATKFSLFGRVVLVFLLMLNGFLWMIQGFYPHSQCYHNIKKEYQGHKIVTIADMSYDQFKTEHKPLSMNHLILIMILHIRFNLLNFRQGDGGFINNIKADNSLRSTGSSISGA